MTPMKAIRETCLECCGGSWLEVKFCPAGNCPLHEYRTGHRPKSIQGPQSPAFDGQKTANCPEGYTDIPQAQEEAKRKEAAQCPHTS